MVTASAPTLSSAQRGAMNADIRGRLEPETQTPEGFSGWRWIQVRDVVQVYYENSIDGRLQVYRNSRRISGASTPSYRRVLRATIGRLN